MSSQIFTPDNLFAGNVMPVVTGHVTLQAGAGALGRGTVLGRVTRTVGDVVAEGTGDGTVTEIALRPSTQLGNYSLVCTAAPTEAAANNAVFAVYAPDGVRMADATQGVAYANDQIAFTIGNATEADFVVGDAFTIPIAAGSGKCVAVNSLNVDGSQHIWAVLAEDADATDADAIAAVYFTGEFNSHALQFSGDDSADTYFEAARKLGMIFRTAVSA